MGFKEPNILIEICFFGHVVNDGSRQPNLINSNDAKHQGKNRNKINGHPSMLYHTFHPIDKTRHPFSIKVLQMFFIWNGHKAVNDGNHQQRQQEYHHDVYGSYDTKLAQ